MTIRQLIGTATGIPSKHPYPEHMTDCRKIAAEGMVLLKNENHTLPLEPGKIALFGAGAVDTVTCGTGSGYIVAPYIVNVEKACVMRGL
jgi:beta-glucosidase